jgi:hypothetical protein
MAIMVMLAKTRILYFNTKDTETTYRERQKKRVRRATNMMRLFYMISYVLLAVRYVITCASRDP